MRLRSKRFFMRAAARLPFLHENKLFSLFPVFRERQRNPGADIQGAVERERRAAAKAKEQSKTENDEKV